LFIAAGAGAGNEFPHHLIGAPRFSHRPLAPAGGATERRADARRHKILGRLRTEPAVRRSYTRRRTCRASGAGWPRDAGVTVRPHALKGGPGFRVAHRERLAFPRCWPGPDISFQGKPDRRAKSTVFERRLRSCGSPSGDQLRTSLRTSASLQRKFGWSRSRAEDHGPPAMLGVDACSPPGVRADIISRRRGRHAAPAARASGGTDAVDVGILRPNSGSRLLGRSCGWSAGDPEHSPVVND